MYLFVLYPGAGETYLTYLLNKAFGIEVIDIESNIELKGAFFYKTTRNLSEISKDLLENVHITYIVRDGRDCIMNNALYRINSIDVNSNINLNIEEAITAAEGSFNGGWSSHLKSWLPIANVVIRFEDLIKSSKLYLTKISQLTGYDIDNSVNIESFNYLKFDDYCTNDVLNSFKEQKLIYYSWDQQFSEYQKQLFYKYHADAMLMLGYVESNTIPKELIQKVFSNLYLRINDNQIDGLSDFKVLVEASKLQMVHNDGIKRYVIELLKSFKEISNYNQEFKIYFFDGTVVKLISEFNDVEYLNKVEGPVSFSSKIKSKIKITLKTVLGKLLSDSSYDRLVFQFKKIKSFLLNSRFYVEFKSLILIIQKKVFLNKVVIFNNNYSIDYSLFDLIHIPLLQDVDHIIEAKGKTLMTLHDLTHLSHPEYHVKENIKFADMGLKLCVEYNADFIAISENTKKDLLKFDERYKNIKVVHEAADNHIFCPLSSVYWGKNIRSLYALEEDAQFILSLSTLEPRKNLKNAIIAFHEALPHIPSNVYLLIAGKTGWKMKDVLPENFKISKRVKFTGFIPEQHLPWLYRESLALIYVSHYEGFGLPLLESMSCGRPVIFGNNSSMIEIVKESGYPVDSNNIIEIKNAIVDVSINQERTNQKALEALTQSNNFTWQNTAIQTLLVYANCINNKKNNK